MPQRPPFFPGPSGSARRASGTRGLRPLVGGYRGGHRVSPRGRMHRETAERRAGGPSGWITHPPLAPACRWQGPRSVRAPSPPRAPGECHQPADTPASLAARPFLGVSFGVGSGGLITGSVGARSGVTKVVFESAPKGPCFRSAAAASSASSRKGARPGSYLPAAVHPRCLPRRQRRNWPPKPRTDQEGGNASERLVDLGSWRLKS